MKPLATSLAQLMDPLVEGADLIAGVTWKGSEYREVILLHFEGMKSPFSVRLEPRERPGEGYLETANLRVSYKGELPMSQEAHSTMRMLGALLQKSENRFRRVEYSEMAAALRESEEIRTHGKTAEVRLIIRCNESCAFCHTDERAENVVFSLSGFKKQLPRLRNEGIETLILTGGEPTLRADLCEFVAAAHAAGFRDIILQTNATRLHQNGLAEKLKAAGLGSFFISLHSFNEKTLATMTGFSRALENTLAGIQAAIELDIPVTINHVITKDNLSELDQFPDLVFKQFGSRVQEIVFSVASPNFWGSEKSDLLLNPGDLKPGLSLALQKASTLGYSTNVPSLCGVPPCVLTGEVREFHRDLAEEFPKFYGREDRIFVGTCEICAIKTRCTGIWKMVADRFGVDWVQAVQEEKITV